APTRVVEVNGEDVTQYVLTPEQAGVKPPVAGATAPAGGTPAQNAAVTRAILRSESWSEGHGAVAGRESAPAAAGTGSASHAVGAAEELALINAGAAIYAAGAADSIAQGVEAARTAIAEGHAASALERYVQATHRHAPAPQAVHGGGSRRGARA
ncbi:MAG TPA: hypothetical protein VED41_02960, partial [Solirubrobacteraceae bacterium]|nr:hypothetical protein [Solirubrobacteraceae bacterium]